MAGEVRVNQQVARKASDAIREGDAIEIGEAERFVSRGGQKLERALSHFNLVVADLTALDIGASTGGFTDCLLQRGVRRVYAVDVGHGQLAWKLRQDSRVVVMERTNARTLTRASFSAEFEGADIAVADCSFISLRKILPPIVDLLKASGKIVALVKPQFEAGKAEADRGAGVIKDAAIHERVLRGIDAFVTDECGLRWAGVVESPLLGPAGNKEFLALIEKQS